MTGDETEMTYKYYQTTNGAIKLSHHGNLVVASIYDQNTGKVFRTISCETYDLMEQIKGFKIHVKNKVGETMMRCW
jgi:hypothetical protein